MAKIHIYHPDAGMPSLQGSSHDYDPSWDYEPIPPPQDPDFDAVAEEVAAKLLPALGLDDMVVFFVESGALEDDVARYIDGTATCPVVAVDLEHIRSCIAMGLDFRGQIHATFGHELAHARLDASTSEETHDIDPIEEERIVEMFARDWMAARHVSLALLDTFADSCRSPAAAAPTA